VFSSSFNVLWLENVDIVSDTSWNHRAYGKLGPFVLMQHSFRKPIPCSIGSCLKESAPYLQTRELTLQQVRFGIFIYVAELGIYFEIKASLSAKINLCLCPSVFCGCADVTPTITLRISGGARASLLVSHV